MRVLLFTLYFLVSFNSHGYELTDEEIVYETLISKLVNSNASAKVIVLDTTKPLYFKNTSVEALKSQFPTLPPEAIEDAYAKKSKPYTLFWHSILTEISFISPQVKNNLNQNFHTYLKEENADLYIELSPIGFSKDRTHALLSVYQMCGVLCGSGSIVELQKVKEGYWDVVNSVTLLWQ